MAVTALLGLPIPQMSDSVGVTIPELASAMQMIDEKLGGSRIVDHNLDVVDPPNGYYARWENGLQVCWWKEPVVHTHPDTIGPIYRSNVFIWTYPASFVSSPVVVAEASNFTWASALTIGLSSSDLISLSPDASARTAFISAVAIGRWK